MNNNEKLEQLREIFAADVYATSTTGIRLTDAAPGYSRCELDIAPHLLNASGRVMGGAIFTLADFAFAVAANYDSLSTVSVTSQISFLAPAKGTRLIAEARSIRSGRTMVFYEISVSDDTGRAVAAVSTTGSVAHL